MNLNNFLCFLVISFLCLPVCVCAQFEFDGQLLGQTSLGLEKQSSKFIGARYLPSLNFKKKTDSLSSFAIQISGNFNATQFLTTEKKN